MAYGYGVSNGHVTDNIYVTPKVLWGSAVGYPSEATAWLLVTLGSRFLRYT